MSLDRLIAQPRPGHHEQMPNVGREIATLMGRDPRYQNCTSADLEFLMNMGLLVREPSARNQCLAHALRMVMFYGGPPGSRVGASSTSLRTLGSWQAGDDMRPLRTADLARHRDHPDRVVQRVR